MPPPWKKSGGGATAATASPAPTTFKPNPAPVLEEAPKKVEPTTTSSWQSKLQNGGSSFEQKAASNGTSSSFGGSKFGGASNGESTSFGGSKFGGAGNNGDAKCNQIKVMFWSAEGSEDDLRRIFSDAGQITRARVLPAREGRDITLCFVTFSTDAEAATAVETLNNYEYEGKKLRVQFDDNAAGRGSGPKQGAKGNKVKVFSCPATLSEDDLKALFSAAGEIQNARVLEPRDGRDTTLAFVTFADDASAEAAVQKFNNHEIQGSSLRVQIDDKDAGKRGGSSSGFGTSGGFGSSSGSSGFGASGLGTSGFGTSAPSSGFGTSAPSSGFGTSAPSSGFGTSAPSSCFGSSSFGGGQSSGSMGNKVKIMFCPASLSEDDVRALFSTAGEIEKVRVLPPRDGRDFTLAFVTYLSASSAEAAVAQLNNHEVEGRRLRVQMDDDSGGNRGGSSGFGGGSSFGGGQSSDAKGNQVKVLSCPTSIAEDDLKLIFASCGDVQNVRILPPRDGRDITLGFVTYSNDDEAAMAVQKLNNYEIEGKTLRVQINVKGGGQRQEGSSSGGWGTPAATSSSNGWGKPADNNESAGGVSVSSQWGTSGAYRQEQNMNGGNSGSFKKSYGRPDEGNQRSGGDRDGGILIDDGEMGGDFSLRGQMSGRAPVVYIPPPPPEAETEIFNDTCHQGINFQKYENIPVEVTGSNPPDRVTSFQQADLHELCRHNIARAKYDKPTPVQKHVLPIVLAKRDVMACAQTGSGKTAAYLLPIISMLLKNGAAEAAPCETASPNALIIVPTRELAIQIFLEARKFAFGSRLRTVVVYGGVSVSHQLGILYDGCNILVATPGRLHDFMGRNRVSLANIEYLVLDEADRMLDMGFGPIMQEIIESENMTSKGKRQTLMLSATFPESIQTLAANYLNDYLFITVGRVGGASSDIVQTMLEIAGSEKRAKLEEILVESGSNRTLVFVETKRSADFLASYLSQKNFPTTSISSDRSQEEREFALRDFRMGKAPVLIATAVAARGLDIPDVKHVINYDLPNDIDEYVHRIGRTGRIGNQGQATAFFDRTKDMKLARGLVKVLSESNQVVPEWLDEVAISAIGTGYGPAGGRFSSRDKRENEGNKQRFNNNQSSGQPDQRHASQPPAKAAAADDDMWC